MTGPSLWRSSLPVALTVIKPAVQRYANNNVRISTTIAPVKIPILRIRMEGRSNYTDNYAPSSEIAAMASANKRPVSAIAPHLDIHYTRVSKVVNENSES